MIELYQSIMQQFAQSKEGAAVSMLLGRSGTTYPGMYLGGKAPAGAPKPLILFFNPSEGTLSQTMQPARTNDIEMTPLQFSIFAASIEDTLKVMSALKIMLDAMHGKALLRNGQVCGRIIDASRIGPGRWMEDPEEGYDGYLEYRFKYWVS